MPLLAPQPENAEEEGRKDQLQAHDAMAVAAWLVRIRGGFAAQRVALSLFLLQLFFNALWSPLFFGLHRPGVALVDLILLWLALLAAVAAFLKAHRLAGVMLLHATG